MGRRINCCDSYLSGNTDGTYVCNECGNSWQAFCGSLGKRNRNQRMRSLVRLALLHNHTRDMTAGQIMEYIKGLGVRNVPTAHQISNFCAVDPHIRKMAAENTCRWKIQFEAQMTDLELFRDE